MENLKKLTMLDAPIDDVRKGCSLHFPQQEKQLEATESRAQFALAFPFFLASDPSFLMFNCTHFEHSKHYDQMNRMKITKKLRFSNTTKELLTKFRMVYINTYNIIREAK